MTSGITIALESSPRIDKFREAARQLGTDDDPERFAERVRNLAKAPPAPADKPKKARTKSLRGG
jgi:hypothetical protein